MNTLCIGEKISWNPGLAQPIFMRVSLLMAVRMVYQTFYLEWVLKNGLAKSAPSSYARVALSTMQLSSTIIAANLIATEYIINYILNKPYIPLLNDLYLRVFYLIILRDMNYLAIHFIKIISILKILLFKNSE